MFQPVYHTITHHLQPITTSIPHHPHITCNHLQPLYHTINTSPTTSIPHCQHITYSQFQPVYHTIHTSPTSSSNQYTTPSTHHLQPVPTSIPHHHHITYNQFQPVYHAVNTSPTRCIKTHHITATSVITLHAPNNFNSQDFNKLPPILTYMYITYMIWTKIIIVIVMKWWWHS